MSFLLCVVKVLGPYDNGYILTDAFQSHLCAGATGGEQWRRARCLPAQVLRLQPEEGGNGRRARHHEGYASPRGVHTGLPLGDTGGWHDAHAAHHGRGAGLRAPASASDRSVLLACFRVAASRLLGVGVRGRGNGAGRLNATSTSVFTFGVLRRPISDGQNEMKNVYCLIFTR